MEGFNFNTFYVMESLDKSEKLTGTELYSDVLRYSDLKDKVLSAHLITINSKEELLNSLIYIKEHCLNENMSPIIHFEIHGCIEGLVTNSNELITWEELHPYLIEINVASRHNLFITLAVCHGAYILQLHQITKRAPFWGFIGSFDEINQGDLMIRYNAFYQTLLNTFDITEAVVELHKSNPEIESSFRFINSEKFFISLYESYIKNEFSEERYHTRWERALNDANTTLANRAEKRRFKKDFYKKLKEENLPRYYRDKEHFFMSDLYPENSKYCSNYIPKFPDKD